MAPDIVDHEQTPGIDATGSEGLRQFVTMLRSAFPDMTVTIEDMIAEEDKVVCRFTCQGTHQGEFAGVAPTGRQATVTGIDILRVTDGRAVEHWGQTDYLSLLQQLGAIPMPEEPAAA